MQRLRRVFGFESERCPKCGARLRVIAVVDDPALIQRILEHLEARGLRHVHVAVGELVEPPVPGGDHRLHLSSCHEIGPVADRVKSESILCSANRAR